MSQPNRQSAPERSAASAYFLVGVTACGKSAVAQFIAERHSYDLLSADSMLVYRGMDIGTAKPSHDERSRVTYHGIDLVDPDHPFSTWDYRQYAAAVLRRNWSARRKTIVVGGSGLYVKSLSAGLRDIPGADASARSRWSEVLERDGVEALQRALEKMQPDIHGSLPDRANPRRLIRALEMAEAGVAEITPSWGKPAAVPMAGLRMPREDLWERIRARVCEMYEGGLVDEVASLIRKYGTLSDSARQAIGYAEVLDFLEGRCTEDAAVERTIVRTRRLAKRQQTWFNHQANVTWVDVGEHMPVDDVARLVLTHWDRHGPVPLRGV